MESWSLSPAQNALPMPELLVDEDAALELALKAGRVTKEKRGIPCTICKTQRRDSRKIGVRK